MPKKKQKAVLIRRLIVGTDFSYTRFGEEEPLCFPPENIDLYSAYESLRHRHIGARTCLIQ